MYRKHWTHDSSYTPYCTVRGFDGIQKPDSWTYNFVEVSGHNLESSQTWGFRIQCLHYKPVPNSLLLRGGRGVKFVSRGRWLLIARRKTLRTFVPITSENSAFKSVTFPKSGKLHGEGKMQWIKESHDYSFKGYKIFKKRQMVWLGGRDKVRNDIWRTFSKID